jgi:glycosyltransferase involved in cell wall biosynthesis
VKKTTSHPDLSIIIPIHNEEGILMSAVNDLLVRLPELNRSFEIILAENGSKDRTVEIAEGLSAKHPEVSVFSSDRPDYGYALRQGIARARGTYVLCDEIDICDVDFYDRALTLLQSGEAALVVGSKAMKGADDKRPFSRRFATSVINSMLRVLLDFKGTDTHGLKAFRRDLLVPIAEKCVVDRDLFASEFVIRAGREGIQVVEIPVQIVEKRAPSIELMRRVPEVLRGLGRLVVAIRFGK